MGDLNKQFNKGKINFKCLIRCNFKKVLTEFNKNGLIIITKSYNL